MFNAYDIVSFLIVYLYCARFLREIIEDAVHKVPAVLGDFENALKLSSIKNVPLMIKRVCVTNTIRFLTK